MLNHRKCADIYIIVNKANKTACILSRWIQIYHTQYIKVFKVTICSLDQLNYLLFSKKISYFNSGPIYQNTQIWCFYATEYKVEDDISLLVTFLMTSLNCHRQCRKNGKQTHTWEVLDMSNVDVPVLLSCTHITVQCW